MAGPPLDYWQPTPSGRRQLAAPIRQVAIGGWIVTRFR